MSQTCLQLIQQVCLRIGINSPNAVVTSSDPQILQLLALSNEEGQAQVARYQWQALRAEATFTTAATQLQGALSTIAPGYKFILNDTIWNRSTRLPVYGSKSPQDWQRNVALGLTSPFSEYRIMGESLYFYPVPAAGESCAFEYLSRYWVNKAAGGTSETWSADGDTCVFDDRIMRLGIVWRWKAEKGLEYAEDFANYEREISDAMARDATKPILSMSPCPTNISPVVIIPSGSWGI
jgi:hypothetical protein